MKETIGEFWLDFNTRPYMYLLNAKLQLLEESKKTDEAIELARHMLILDSNDNLGSRYRLINLLLRINDFTGIDELNENFEGEFILGWHYSIALRYFKDNQLENGTKYLKEALKFNSNVAEYLLANRTIYYPLPDNYSLGSDEEAIIYAEFNKDIWTNTKDAIKWLKAIKLDKPFIRAIR